VCHAPQDPVEAAIQPNGPVDDFDWEAEFVAGLDVVLTLDIGH
jgi:hypothetical protein